MWFALACQGILMCSPLSILMESCFYYHCRFGNFCWKVIGTLPGQPHRNHRHPTAGYASIISSYALFVALKQLCYSKLKIQFFRILRNFDLIHLSKVLYYEIDFGHPIAFHPRQTLFNFGSVGHYLSNFIPMYPTPPFCSRAKNKMLAAMSAHFYFNPYHYYTQKY